MMSIDKTTRDHLRQIVTWHGIAIISPTEFFMLLNELERQEKELTTMADYVRRVDQENSDLRKTVEHQQAILNKL